MHVYIVYLGGKENIHRRYLIPPCAVIMLEYANRSLSKDSLNIKRARVAYGAWRRRCIYTMSLFHRLS